MWPVPSPATLGPGRVPSPIPGLCLTTPPNPVPPSQAKVSPRRCVSPSPTQAGTGDGTGHRQQQSPPSTLPGGGRRGWHAGEPPLYKGQGRTCHFTPTLSQWPRKGVWRAGPKGASRRHVGRLVAPSLTAWRQRREECVVSAPDVCPRCPQGWGSQCTLAGLQPPGQGSGQGAAGRAHPSFQWRGWASNPDPLAPSARASLFCPATVGTPGHGLGRKVTGLSTRYQRMADEAGSGTSMTTCPWKPHRGPCELDRELGHHRSMGGWALRGYLCF